MSLLSDTATLRSRYAATRARTEALARRLEPEDCVVQTMDDVSPTKWHLAHTTWFFETMVLAPSVPGYVPFDRDYAYLFNSYYESLGDRHARPRRGRLTRPTLEEVFEYREHVDDAVRRVLDGDPPVEVVDLIQVGLHHEEQHQELILTDIKHVLGTQPLEPAMWSDGENPEGGVVREPRRFLAVEGGVVAIGHDGEGFAFDNEKPRHDVLVQAFSIASRPVTNGEFLAFVEAGGYARPELWLSDGLQVVRDRGWKAPLYWRRQGGRWTHFTLAGRRPLDPDEPVRHVSYYEADAFARFAGARLPTEQEWELAWHQVDAVRDTAGVVWEWTASPHTAYPGYRAADGPLGEYNGKFMCNQMVLRGGSRLTPAGHARPTYRNYFYPDARWQFSGLRLAR